MSITQWQSGVAQTQEKSFNFNGESDLDLEYAFAMTNPQVGIHVFIHLTLTFDVIIITSLCTYFKQETLSKAPRSTTGWMPSMAPTVHSKVRMIDIYVYIYISFDTRHS